MTLIALARVNYVQAIGDVGDRTNLGMSTAISNEEWHIEAPYENGSIGDVRVYRNTSVHIKGATANWQWYTAIPTANIKAYSPADPPVATTLPDGKPKAQTAPARSAAGAGAGAKS